MYKNLIRTGIVFAVMAGGLHYSAHAAMDTNISLPDWLPENFPIVEDAENTLCVKYFLSPHQARSVLNSAVENFPDKADWEHYFKLVKEKIQEGLGLDPWPVRTPLHPVFSNKRQYPGYSVQNVAFESIPGYWVTGNLYLPDHYTGNLPAVLHTHGHSSNIDDPGGWAKHGRFKADVQYRAAALALMGAVSLTIDMYGYGDSTALVGPHSHRDSVNMPLQVWNAMRALDFLQGLDMVDPGALAVTGHSGGGTQAFLLSALDERVRVCVPVAMVSARFFGGCTCESGKPIHLSPEHFVNNAMIAAMTVPRPLMVISDGGDWTDQVPEVEFPFLKEVYKDFGVSGKVENVHLPEEGHNYGPSKRAAMYPFMARYLHLDLGAILDDKGAIDESGVVIEDPDQMRVFGAEFPVPDDALKSGLDIERALESLQQKVDRVRNGDDLKPYALSCDYMENPVGVDSGRPRLSWKLLGEGRNRRQTAWQIQVAGKESDFVEGTDLLWDSGRVDDAQQLQIPYGGPPLSSTETVYWRIRAWNETGKMGPWSEVAKWTMGIVDADDWKADWITHPEFLKYDRPQLGYRSKSADSIHSPRWVLLDLGKRYPIDAVVLHALRHTVAERLGFPTEFVVEVSDSRAFADARILMDTRGNPSKVWLSSHRIDGKGGQARFIRLQAPVLRDVDGEICLALSQIEVISGGTNIAPGSVVTASDSIESEIWSMESLVDGKGIPQSNPTENKTLILGKQFQLGTLPERAIVHVSGLGHYVLRINGKRVGDRKLSPGWTRYEKTILYDSLDVAEYLREGINVVELQLAGGMYSVPHPGENRYSKFIGRTRPLEACFQMELVRSESEKEWIVSDRSWKAKFGSVAYAHMYGGEVLDLRIVNGFWDGFDDETNGWWPIECTRGPGGTLRGGSRSAPPVKVVEQLEPIAFVELSDSMQVVDLGQNTSIMPRLTASGPEGSLIRIIPGELLKADGQVDRGSCGGRLASWDLILDGSRERVLWEPEFFYHGARYLQVERYPAMEGGALPEVLGLSGLVVHSSAQPAGSFSCSSSLFNQTRELINWAQRSNMVSVLTDCPHRERLGWLEQYHLNGPAIRYEHDMAGLFRKTFFDMEDAQTDRGLIPDIAPEFTVFNAAFRDSPEWGSALILAAWQQYVYAGDIRVLKDHYAAMTRYMEYLLSTANGYLIDHGLGDWYDIGPERPGFAQLTPRALTATATAYEDAITLAKMALLLGRNADSKHYSQLAERIKTAFNEAFLNTDSGLYSTGSQTANAMPYYLGMVPEPLTESVLDSLVRTIREGDNMLTSGDVGHAYLLRALAKAERSDVIFDMHHRWEGPGYGMQLRKGATSLTEAWDAGRHSSQNHFMLGHITEWFYHDLAGIAPDPDEPGFKHVVIKPQPCGDIKEAKATHETPYGPVSVEWSLAEDGFQLSVELPANTKGTIHLPISDGQAIEEVGGLSKRAILPVEVESGRARIEVGSGRYIFITRKPSEDDTQQI